MKNPISNLPPHEQSLMQRLLLANGETGANTRLEELALKAREMESPIKTVNGCSSPTNYGYKGPEMVSFTNNVSSLPLVCIECGMIKNTTEEMEVHLKVEHLNWLPFRCPVCYTERASDAAMREHVHAVHREKLTNFIYADNIDAKRQMTSMMDQCIANALLYPISGSNGRYGSSDKMEISTRARSDCAETSPSTSSPGVTVMATAQQTSKTHNGVAQDLLDSICKAARDGGIIDGEVFDQENGHKHNISASDLDMDGENNVLDTLNPIAVLDDVAALFNTETCKEEIIHDKAKHNGKGSNGVGTKKRVLGECSKCNKPVTAGARQMHMFFHLAKDHGIYRFRCMFDGCNTEHYRKDQMENHQVKAHGKIEPDMMEDRSLELFARCQALNHELFVANRSVVNQQQSAQELSMELIGTKNGTAPGTHAKSEVSTAQQNSSKDKEKSRQSAVKSESVSQTATGDDDRILQCRICKKTMQNRLRGFHVLWHMAKDLNINRYICVVCGFCHDRAQSVQTHGKKEHRDHPGDVCRDRINEYDKEVKTMSMRCFGFESSFATPDNKRRSKIPVTPVVSQKTGRKRIKLEIDETADEAVEDYPHSGADSPDTSEEVEVHDVPVNTRKRKGSTPNAAKDSKIVLREVCKLVEGAQYLNRKPKEKLTCAICSQSVSSRVTEHCYEHMTQSLFVCPVCDFGNNSRDHVKKHITEEHETVERPIDHRLKYAIYIKETIQKCYPKHFVDAALPSPAYIELLRNAGGKEALSEIDDERDTRSFVSMASLYSMYSDDSSGESLEDEGNLVMST